MAKKRKTLPKEIKSLLEQGDIEALKKMFLNCEPNAITNKYGSNIFSLAPLPREFAFWAKEQGADVNFVDHYGKTPIFDQASSWQGDVQLLIDLGADVHVEEHNGVTPLHLACMYGRVNAVKALLKAGIDANVQSGKMDFPGFLTPLEETLLQNRLPYENLLEICSILLEHGATITDRACEYLRKSAQHFQQVKRGIEDLAFLHSQTQGLEKLYKIFDVEPVAEPIFHDGVSAIHIPEKYKDKAFQWLWDYLVPPSGHAQTAQGEIIRIAGKVEHEFLDNGCINWDEEFQKMLNAFPQYLSLGNAFSEKDIQAAEILTTLLIENGKKGYIDDFLCSALCECAIAWVQQNSEVIQPLKANYNR